MRKNSRLRYCLAMALCVCMLLGAMGNMTKAFAILEEENLSTYLDENSFYVAIVDKNSKDNAACYADKLASQIGCAYVKTTVEDLSAITQADLITVGFTQTEVMSFMVKQVKDYSTVAFGGTYKPCDWSLIVGQEHFEAVEEIRAQLLDRIDSMNLGNMSGYATVAVDAYAYAYVEQLNNSIKTVEAISAVNPEAMIVLVGQYNPVEGAVLTAGESVMPMDEYIQYLVDLFNERLLSYAEGNNQVIYAEASAVETVRGGRGEILNMPVVNFIMNLLMKPDNLIGDMYPSENGHTYIKDQVIHALIAGEEPMVDFTIETVGTNNAAAYTVSDDFQALNVVNEEYACVVAYTDSARQSYTRLTAVANGDGYDYDLSAVPSDAIIVIAVKGDINGDGVLSGIEVTRIKAEQLGKTAAFTALQKLVADVDGDGELKGIEVTRIKAAQLGKTMLAW